MDDILVCFCTKPFRISSICLTLYGPFEEAIRVHFHSNKKPKTLFFLNLHLGSEEQRHWMITRHKGE